MKLKESKEECMGRLEGGERSENQCKSKYSKIVIISLNKNKEIKAVIIVK